MAMMMQGGGGGGRRGRRRRGLNSEINVTPFVDVMLVLLIVFMVHLVRHVGWIREYT